MKLKLERYQSSEKATLGTLSIDGELVCWTLEDVDRHLEVDPHAKIPGQTAIPRGTYEVIIDFSNHFQRLLPHVLDVPGYEGVRIHAGNTDKDTEGCILCGGKPLSEDFIPNSRATFEKVFSMLDGAVTDGKPITLEVA